MSSDDPFLVAKDEALTSLSKAKAFFQQFNELLADTNNSNVDKLDWTATELRNSLRSIEWDIEDLDETLGITISNRKKIKVTDSDIETRKQFVRELKDEVNEMKNKLNEYKSVNTNGNKSQEKRNTFNVNSVINASNLTFSNAVGVTGSAKYTKLQNQVESPTKSKLNDNDNDLGISIVEDNKIERPQIYQPQSNNTSQSIKMIPNNHIVDEHAIMLDDNDHDLIVESKLKKVARVLHLTSDRQQWTVIGVVSSIVFLVFIVFMAL